MSELFKYTIKDLESCVKGKKVVIIGSAPSCLLNSGKHIDSYDVVIRINNYKIEGIEKHVGERMDYHYSFYGSSVRTKKEELLKRGIKAHLCKCPNDICHETHWHTKIRRNNNGGDFRWIYKNRLAEGFWVAPVYIPEKEHYMKLFLLLDGHVPTTGLSCVWEILNCEPDHVYVTGFDFFSSKVHNVNERWRPGSPQDPIGHRPDKEKALFKKWVIDKKPIVMDKILKGLL